VLSKVRVSGGGRCNVTHACFDARTLCAYYPRGSRELLGPFHTFGPHDTIDWFADQNVQLKEEPDGRMFPTTDSSETIIDCFISLCNQHEITIHTSEKVTDFEAIGSGFNVTSNRSRYNCKKLVISAGSSPSIWNLCSAKGLEISSAVPSLFTFNLANNDITQLMGVSVGNVDISIVDTKIKTSGPILVTHWGLSGPAILKASAWGARVLHEKNYDFNVNVDWVPSISDEQINTIKFEQARKKPTSTSFVGVPSRLWHYLLSTCHIPDTKTWADLNKQEMNAIVNVLKRSNFKVKGKTTFKEEFVTAGGVALHQVNFKSYELKKHPNFYIVGEALDIDALTGGFNFQAAWTGGFIAAQHIVDTL
jgi:predicted Rossmann fold flavoprotein